MSTLNLPPLNPFQRAYIEAALWSTNDESTPQGGEPLDKNYSVDDIDPHTLLAMMHECAAFEAQCQWVLNRASCNRGTGEWSEREQAGHDFWLTRNGHGCGFWDGDWTPKRSATILTNVSEAFGEVYLYVGDDGKIYQSGSEPERETTDPASTGTHYVYGGGSVGCLYDYGPHCADSKESAISNLEQIYDLSEQEMETLRTDGILYFDSSEGSALDWQKQEWGRITISRRMTAGADYCDVSEHPGPCPEESDE